MVPDQNDEPGLIGQCSHANNLKEDEEAKEPQKTLSKGRSGKRIDLLSSFFRISFDCKEFFSYRAQFEVIVHRNESLSHSSKTSKEM